MAEVAHLKEDIQAGEARERDLDAALGQALAVIPNVPLAEVPLGRDEKDNPVHHTHGEPRRIDWAKEHFDLGEGMGLMDFERAARLSGARFTVLKGALARLERSLGQFMIDTHTGDHATRSAAAAAGPRRDHVRHRQPAEVRRGLFRTTTGVG